MVPHLVTALSGPINELEQRILESLPAIERWFRLEWMEHTPPFYTAVDLRNAGYKLAPVDTDLFPNTFHALTPQMLPLAVQAAMAAIEKICPEARNLLLIPQADETGSASYGENIRTLIQVFTQAGLNVRLGTLDPKAGTARTLKLPDGEALTLEPVLRRRGRLGLKDFDPCTILLNDDLGGGTPKPLHELHEQWLLPPLHAGWGRRRKSVHFSNYEEVAKKFAKLLGMDPWLITALHARCGEVDLASADGLDCVRGNVDALLQRVRRKHKEYGIAERPFVVVKADGGHEQQGLIALHDPRDLEAALAGLKARAGGELSTEVIIQEGVPTYERVHDALAEPVVTMIDRYVVGGFYRVHAGRSAEESLAAPGARHVPLAFDESHRLPRPGEKPGASAPNRFYMYGVIGRLAMLGAAYELEATDPAAEDLDD